MLGECFLHGNAPLLQMMVHASITHTGCNIHRLDKSSIIIVEEWEKMVSFLRLCEHHVAVWHICEISLERARKKVSEKSRRAGSQTPSACTATPLERWRRHNRSQAASGTCHGVTDQDPCGLWPGSPPSLMCTTFLYSAMFTNYSRATRSSSAKLG